MADTEDLALPSKPSSIALGAPMGSRTETEPTVAVAPDGHVAVAWLDATNASAILGVGFSADRGATWSPSSLLDVGPQHFASNEIVAADSQGNFHLVTLAVANSQHNAQVLFATAPTGAQSFGAYTEVSDPALGAPRDASALTIAHDGSLNVVWTEYNASLTAAQIVAARSTDGGAHWTRTPITSADDGDAWPNLCSSRTSGKVVAVFIDRVQNTTSFRWSDDDGATWPAGNVNAAPISTHEGEFPSCFTIDNDVWVMQGVSLSPPSQTLEPTLDDIQLTHSGDGGFTLDPKVSVQDPAAGPKYMRAAAAIEADRSISLVYYAGAQDNDPAATVRHSRSIDKGKTFSASEILYQPITLTTSRAGTNWLGDLLGITADAQGSYVVFVDNGSGQAHIRYVRLAP
jgi:hypothetical protein